MSRSKKDKAQERYEADKQNESNRQHQLVRKAILDGQLHWECDAVARLAQSRCDGLEPREIKRSVIEYIKNGGIIKPQLQHPEDRDAKEREFDWYYSISFDVPEIGSIYVKAILVDDDNDAPEARLVDGHK